MGDQGLELSFVAAACLVKKSLSVGGGSGGGGDDDDDAIRTPSRCQGFRPIITVLARNIGDPTCYTAAMKESNSGPANRDSIG